MCLTDIPSKYFVCLHKIFKTSSRLVFKTSSMHVFKTFSRHVFKTSSRYVFKTFSRHVFKTSSRHVFKTSSRHVFKTSSRHAFKTSSRRLQRNKFSSSKTPSRRLARGLRGAFKTSWKTENCYAEDVLKTSLIHFLKTSSRLTNVCWDSPLGYIFNFSEQNHSTTDGFLKICEMF